MKNWMKGLIVILILSACTKDKYVFAAKKNGTNWRECLKLVADWVQKPDEWQESFNNKEKCEKARAKLYFEDPDIKYP